jgi:cytochrome c-type biogenesis protein CcmH/NrfG
MLATVIVFGVHSTVDWTWFFPGTTVIALACAGWLAGRGPLSQRIGLAPRRKRLTANPVTGAAAVAIVAVTVIAAWAVWQPLRSFDADASAVSADVRGDGAAALTDARTAASTDPVAVEPLFTLAAIYQGMGQPASARRELQKAVNLQPDNPTTWLQLGEFDLANMHQPGLALAELRRALSLDLTSTQAAADIMIAQQQLQQSAHR